MDNRSDSGLLTVAEAASQLRRSQKTIRFWMGTGKIEYVKIGGRVNIKQAVVDFMIERGTIEADGRKPAGSVRRVALAAKAAV